MKFTDLSLHIHTLRQTKSGRRIGSAMRLPEVANAAVQSDLNNITKVFYRFIDLDDKLMGTFCRLNHTSSGEHYGVVFVNKRMPSHWQEFVAIKETMHCWSPDASYVSGAQNVASLLSAHIGKVGSYSITPIIAADVGAIAAAAEVMLPTASVTGVLTGKIDFAELAHRHGLHVDIVTEICKFDMILARQNGSF